MASTTYNQHTAYIGYSSVGLFLVSFVIFNQLNQDFHPLNDYISYLGARGQPFALIWNVIGFGLVGLMCALFGWRYGQNQDDLVVGLCLAFGGLTYAMAAIPTDINNFYAVSSRAHFVLICLSMAGWCFAFARIAHISSTNPIMKRRSNWTITLLMLPFAGWTIGLYDEPILQRMIILVVFSWIVITSYDILKSHNKN